MNPFRQISSIARLEAAYFATYPKLPFILLIVVLIPALYALIYLTSVWDPEANTGALNVGFVNQDEGMTYREQTYNIGREVVTKLKESGEFGFREMHDEKEARRLVREGKLAFALIIPPEFSSHAIPGILVGAGKAVVYVSEGNSYQDAGLAKRFADLLTDQINDSLNEQRWRIVLMTAAGSQQSIDLLRNGVAQLSKGAHELSSGARQTADGAHQLNTGSEQLGNGVRQLTTGVKQIDRALRLADSKRPTNAELAQLKSGAERLAAGELELQNGMNELHNGSQQLQTGMRQFKGAADDSMWVPGAVSSGLGQLSNGVDKLDAGIAAAATAQGQLTDGAAQLSDGVGKLTDGMQTLGNGLHTMITRLPLTSQLNELSSGSLILSDGAEKLDGATKSVAKGAQMLAVGIDQLQQALPSKVTRPDGSPEGLARSVEPVVEKVAPVKNNGSAFAPNVIPAALWLGAGVVAFLLHVRILPPQAQPFSRPVKVLGKSLLPICLALSQALAILFAAKFLLHMEIVNLPGFIISLAVASASFLMIIYALTLALGDAGKAMSMLLFALQLSASSGIMPVELSGKLFMAISPWLPLTWVVKALKATMFGAFDGQWIDPLLHAILGGLVAFAIACITARWRYAEAGHHRPPIEL